MTEPVIAPTPSQILEARGREAWVRAGHDPVKFDQRMSGATSAPAPAHTAPVAPKQAPAGAGERTLPVAQAQKMSARLLAQGVPQERVDAALAQSGVELPKGTLTPAQVEHNKDFGLDKLYSPQDYRIDLRPLGSMDIGDAKAIQTEFSTAMSEMNLQPGLGSALAQHLLQLGAQNAKSTPAQLALTRSANLAELGRKFGAGLPAVLEQARAALSLIKDVDLRGRIEALGPSPWLVSTLASHARNIARWQAGKPKS